MAFNPFVYYLYCLLALSGSTPNTNGLWNDIALHSKFGTSKLLCHHVSQHKQPSAFSRWLCSPRKAKQAKKSPLRYSSEEKRHISHETPIYANVCRDKLLNTSDVFLEKINATMASKTTLVVNKQWYWKQLNDFYRLKARDHCLVHLHAFYNFEGQTNDTVKHNSVNQILCRNPWRALKTYLRDLWIERY